MLMFAFVADPPMNPPPRPRRRGWWLGHVRPTICSSWIETASSVHAGPDRHAALTETSPSSACGPAARNRRQDDKRQDGGPGGHQYRRPVLQREMDGAR